MKKLLPCLLAALLCLPGTAAPEEARAADAEYVLSLNLPIPPIHNRWNYALKPWIEELEKRSNGRIRVEPYFAEALSKEADAFESVKTGVADMAEFSYDVAVGSFPSTSGCSPSPAPACPWRTPRHGCWKCRNPSRK